MIIVPILLNSVQLWVIDGIIKHKALLKDTSKDKEDDMFSQESEDEACV